MMEKVIREIKLARGVLLQEGRILLVQDIRPGQGHFFLPGGNVETGEPIRQTLPREWMKELGWEIHVGDFLGCLEHSWSYERKDGAQVQVFEMNFLFGVHASAELLASEPVSREPHLQFSWVPLKEIRGLRLLPEPLKIILPEIAGASRAIWISTLTSPGP